MSNSRVFDRIYQDYLMQVKTLDFDRVMNFFGLHLEDNGLIIPLYGIPHLVTPEGIRNGQGLRPSHSVSVVLCKYLLMCSDVGPTNGEWVTYKDFQDAAPFAGGFRNYAEKPLERAFTGRIAALGRACLALDGQPLSGFSSQLAYRFEALPRLPLLLLFNDKDDELPAQCTLLFEKRAEKFLDMECLAILGWILSEWLRERI